MSLIHGLIDRVMAQHPTTRSKRRITPKGS
jgi:hypothetical protein